MLTAVAGLAHDGGTWSRGRVRCASGAARVACNSSRFCAGRRCVRSPALPATRALQGAPKATPYPCCATAAQRRPLLLCAPLFD